MAAVAQHRDLAAFWIWHARQTEKVEEAPECAAKAESCRIESSLGGHWFSYIGRRAGRVIDP
jgi:hypothetical protein